MLSHPPELSSAVPLALAFQLAAIVGHQVGVLGTWWLVLALVLLVGTSAWHLPWRREPEPSEPEALPVTPRRLRRAALRAAPLFAVSLAIALPTAGPQRGAGFALALALSIAAMALADDAAARRPSLALHALVAGAHVGVVVGAVVVGVAQARLVAGFWAGEPLPGLGELAAALPWSIVVRVALGLGLASAATSWGITRRFAAVPHVLLNVAPVVLGWPLSVALTAAGFGPELDAAPEWLFAGAGAFLGSLALLPGVWLAERFGGGPRVADDP